MIITGGCYEPQADNSSEDSCIKPAGYQTVIECDHDEFPNEIISTCHKNGSWIQNTMGCSGE